MLLDQIETAENNQRSFQHLIENRKHLVFVKENSDEDSEKTVKKRAYSYREKKVFMRCIECNVPYVLEELTG